MSEAIGQKGPQIRRREAWVDLPEEYEGFRFKVWLNAPSRLWVDIGSAGDDEDTAQSALRQIVLEHNGWLDFDGQPYPQPDKAVFWEDIPTELAACMLIATQQEMGKLPNSLAPTKRRSRRG